RVLEGDDSAEREEGPAFETPLGLGHATGETVDDRARRHPGGVENLKRLVPRVPGVDDQGEVVLVGEGNLFAERRSLGRPRAVLVEVVQTALTDRDDRSRR